MPSHILCMAGLATTKAASINDHVHAIPLPRPTPGATAGPRTGRPVDHDMQPGSPAMLACPGHLSHVVSPHQSRRRSRR